MVGTPGTKTHPSKVKFENLNEKRGVSRRGAAAGTLPRVVVRCPRELRGPKVSQLPKKELFSTFFQKFKKKYALCLAGVCTPHPNAKICLEIQRTGRLPYFGRFLFLPPFAPVVSFPLDPSSTASTPQTSSPTEQSSRAHDSGSSPPSLSTND